MDWSTNYTAGNYLAIWDNAGNCIRPIPKGSTSVGYATSAGNADTVDSKHASDFASSGHNHDGRYVRYYTVTTLDCNNLAVGLTAAGVSATNAAHINHSAFLYISDVGTPFQLQIPDFSIPYIYKRYYSSGTWSGWFKLNAGYADSAGSASNLQTSRLLWGQPFDGTGDVSGSLSGVGHIQFSADNTYNIGSNSAASKYIYTYWLGAKSGQKLELGANNSNYGQGLCIDTNLNVGIGTSTPAYKLHVNGQIHSSFASNNGNPCIMVNPTNDTNWCYGIEVLATKLTAGHRIGAYWAGKANSTNNAICMSYYHAGDGSGDNKLIWNTWGSGDKMALTANGNVGIGTTNPSSRLTINGDISLFNVGSIRNLAIGGGIYWNPYVESASDGSDAASITLVKSGVVGGTTLVLSQMNDTNDTIQFQTNVSARLYHNSYPILTTQNTYVSNNKGYINGTEITQVNNADKVDGYHASSFLIDRGGNYQGLLYDLPCKSIFSGYNLSDSPTTEWVSGIVLGSNWNNSHYQHYLVESGSRWYATRGYSSGKMTNWNTFAYLTDIPNPTDYYWANVKISTSASTTTSPTVSDLTATSSIRMGDILLEHTDEINNSDNGSLYLNYRSSGDVNLCQGGGKVGIGTGSPQTALDIRSNEIAPLSVNGAIKLATNPNGVYYYQPICVAIGQVTNTQTEYNIYCNTNITCDTGQMIEITFNDIPCYESELSNYMLFISDRWSDNTNSYFLLLVRIN